MADIDVERTSGPTIWPWLLGLLALALLAWLLFSQRGGDRPVATATDTVPAATAPAAETAPAALPAAAETYMQQCHLAEGTRTEGMGLDHDFTVNCLEQLAASLEGLAQQRTPNPQVDQQIQTIRQNAQSIRESAAESTMHANWTREAALAGAVALESMHQTWHAGNQQVSGAVQQTRQSAEQIQTTDAHLEQLTDVRSFFRSAGDAMQALAQRQPA